MGISNKSVICGYKNLSLIPKFFTLAGGHPRPFHFVSGTSDINVSLTRESDVDLCRRRPIWRLGAFRPADFARIRIRRVLMTIDYRVYLSHLPHRLVLHVFFLFSSKLLYSRARLFVASTYQVSDQRFSYFTELTVKRTNLTGPVPWSCSDNVEEVSRDVALQTKCKSSFDFQSST